MIRFARLTLAAWVAASLPAQAAQLLPGLWEFTSEELVVDGIQMPGMSEMLAQMKELPPDQRKMMESMLAEQGVELSSGSIRICLSEAQVESRKLPFQDEPGCTQEVLEQTDSLWRFRFECPDASGHGETKVINEREVASTIETTYTTGEQQGTSRMQSRGQWVGEDCGPLQPQT